MGVDIWMAATPAPHYDDGTIDHPLSDVGSEILRRRIQAIPAHLLRGTGITQGNSDLELEEMHACTYSLLEDAISESLTLGIGCTSVTNGRTWLVGGGMDPGEGFAWSQRIAALALTGVTELPLDAGSRRVAPSLKQAGAIVRRPELNNQIVAIARALLHELDCTPHRMRTISQSVGELMQERQQILVDLLALTLRSRWSAFNAGKQLTALLILPYSLAYGKA